MSSRFFVTALAWLALLVILVLLFGCATVESGADHVRDFAKAHPVITSVAAAAVVAGAAAAIEHHHDQAVTARRCVAPPHGDVLLPPGGGELICQ